VPPQIHGRCPFIFRALNRSRACLKALPAFPACEQYTHCTTLSNNMHWMHLYLRLDISSSSPDCDHNLYAVPCPLNPYRNSRRSSGLKTQIAWTRRLFMTFMQIMLTGVGDHFLRANVAVRNCALTFDHGWDAYPGL